MMEQTDLAETVIGLVGQYSPSGQEENAVAWLVERMQALGYSQAFIDGAGNAVGIMGTGSKQVMLLGHIDTVPGEIPLRVKDGTLYGRGAVDAKGPLASFVDAVAQVGEVDDWQFIVIGAVDEERESKGARYVASQYHPDFVIIGEPNHWHRVALGYKGIACSEINFKRSQAHAASSRQTACEAAVVTWQSIQNYVNTYNSDKERGFDQLLLTLHSMNSEEGDFYQMAQLNVDTRLPVGITPEKWYETLDQLTGDDELIRKGFAVPAWNCEKNTPLVRAFLSSIRSQDGKPAFVYKTGTADLNTVCPIWHIPALVYGPGDSKLDHTLDEKLELGEYQKAVTVLKVALQKLTS